MRFLVYLSDFIIPFVILYVVGMGLVMKVPIFDAFMKGAEDGFKVVCNILPTLIGLMVAVGILRASGAMDNLGNAMAPLISWMHFPAELVPLVLVKIFSSSAATGLLLDIFKEFGTDSYIGRLASLLMSCSETIFYTMAVYFMTAGVRKTRYTLAGSLFAAFAGIAASVVLAGMM